MIGRRGFFGALLAGAAAFVVAPAAKAPASSPSDQSKAFPYSSGQGMREIGLHERPTRAPMDLRIMCWDCKWTSPWIHESVSINGVFAPYETHLAAVHPNEAIDHEMQWRPSQWQWPEYLESVDEQVTALTPVDQIAEARAEGYERGRAVEASRQESRALVKQQEMIAYGPDANWYLEQTDHGMWQVIDNRTGEVYTGPPTVEMLDELQYAAARSGGSVPMKLMPGEVRAVTGIWLGGPKGWRHSTLT